MHQLHTFQLFDTDNSVIDQGFEVYRDFYAKHGDNVVHMQFINGIMFVYTQGVLDASAQSV